MSKEYSLLLVEDEKNILYGMKNVLACTLNRLSEVLTAEMEKRRWMSSKWLIRI